MSTNPGENALIAMNNMNKTLSLFKTPQIPLKKKDKQEILTEERYIEVNLYFYCCV